MMVREEAKDLSRTFEDAPEFTVSYRIKDQTCKERHSSGWFGASELNECASLLGMDFDVNNVNFPFMIVMGYVYAQLNMGKDYYAWKNCERALEHIEMACMHFNKAVNYEKAALNRPEEEKEDE